VAYVVRRAHGRFEIRESVHTQRGPRARTLASFSLLTDDVLSAAAGRAQRPFDVERVRISSARCGARTETSPPGDSAGAVGQGRDRYRGFVESSRRMAASLAPAAVRRRDPGEALIDLLGFTEQVTRSQPARRYEPLQFPPLAEIVEERRSRRSMPER
jgi:hypothetical protein